MIPEPRIWAAGDGPIVDPHHLGELGVACEHEGAEREEDADKRDRELRELGCAYVWRSAGHEVDGRREDGNMGAYRFGVSSTSVLEV